MSSTSEAWPEPWPDDALPREWMKNLFDRMIAFYGAKFLDQWRGADMENVMRTWGRQLAKLHRTELKAGVKALEGQEWPPTLPQFIKLCRHVIEPMRAYYEAVEGLQARSQGEIGHWSHPAIFWTATRMNYELRTYSFSQISTRWEQALADELDKGQWAEIPAPYVALPAPVCAPRNTAAFRQAMAQVSDMVRRQDDKDFDHLRWARRIAERAQHDKHGLSLVQLEFAKEALKNTKENP